MSFATTMTALKDKVDGLIANRVAKFAYTQQAYNSDDVNGVTEYNYSAEQNVPTSSASVLKVNETVLTKGWRTQASAITRMLMNHFLGRTSYNLNKTVDFLKAFMLAIENNMGVAEGFATLDENTQLPLAQLTPDVIIDCGEWDADTNTPELEIGEGRKGDTYRVSVAGTQNLGEGLITYRTGDTIMYNGSIWVKTASGTVSSVNTVTPDETGNITLTGEDINISSKDAVSITDKIYDVLKLSFTPLLCRTFVTTLTGVTMQDGIYYHEGYWYACIKNASTTMTPSTVSNGVYRTKDGKTWQPTSIIADGSDTNLTSDMEFYFIKSNSTTTYPDRIIIGTNKGILYTDTYFVTYEWSNLTDGTFSNSACGILENNIAIIGKNRVYYTENNGSTWEESNLAVSANGGKIFADKDSKLMVINACVGSSYLYTLKKSTDMGASWVNYSVTGTDWTTLEYYPESKVYIACGGTAGICYSNNSLVTFVTVTTNINVKVNVVVQGKSASEFIAGTSAGLYQTTAGVTQGWAVSNVTSGNYTKLVHANGLTFASIASGTSIKLKSKSYASNYWNDTTLTGTAPWTFKYFNGVWLLADTTTAYITLDGIDFEQIGFTNGAPEKAQLVHGIVFMRNYASNSNFNAISSVYDLIERGWVNID